MGVQRQIQLQPRAKFENQSINTAAINDFNVTLLLPFVTEVQTDSQRWGQYHVASFCFPPHKFNPGDALLHYPTVSVVQAFHILLGEFASNQTARRVTWTQSCWQGFFFFTNGQNGARQPLECAPLAVLFSKWCKIFNQFPSFAYPLHESYYRGRNFHNLCLFLSGARTAPL